MLGVSLLVLYLSIFVNIPISRFIVRRPSGIDDMLYTKSKRQNICD